MASAYCLESVEGYKVSRAKTASGFMYSAWKPRAVKKYFEPEPPLSALLITENIEQAKEACRIDFKNQQGK